MKNKEIMKIIKQNIESNIPKNAPSIDFPFEEEKTFTKVRRPWYSYGQLALTTLLSVVIIVLSVAILLNQNEIPTPPSKLLESDQDIVSFSAISSMSLLSTITVDESMGISMLLSTELTSQEQPDLITSVLPYLRSIEQILSSNLGLNFTSGLSTLEGYDYYMQFETKNLINVTTTYVMHYNIVLVDEDDDESEYTLTGVLLFKDQSYQVIGEKKLEDDEEKVSFKAYKNEQSYVESYYEIENDQRVFNFKVVSNGITVSESMYELEQEDDEIKIKLSFTEGNNEGEYQFEYFTEDDINLIKIEFQTNINDVESSGKMVVQMIIDEVTGDSKYLISVKPDEGDEYEYEADDDDDEDDDEEEEEDDDDEEDDIL